MPALTVTENGGRVRLIAAGCLRLVMAFRATGFKACSEAPPDLETMSFLYELGEIAAAGGDIRARVFA